MVPDEGNALIKIDDDGMAFSLYDIYNKLKEFYHRHYYHAVDDGDSIIKPFVTFGLLHEGQKYLFARQVQVSSEIRNSQCCSCDAECSRA